MPIVKQGDMSTIFWVFGMTRPGIEPWSFRPLANTLPLSQYIYNDLPFDRP